VRSPPPEEEEVAETVCDELTTIPIPCPSAPLVLGDVENSGVKLSPGRVMGEGRWGDVLRFSFNFSLSYSDLIGNKLN